MKQRKLLAVMDDCCNELSTLVIFPRETPIILREISYNPRKVSLNKKAFRLFADRIPGHTHPQGPVWKELGTPSGRDLLPEITPTPRKGPGTRNNPPPMNRPGETLPSPKLRWQIVTKPKQ